MSKYTDMADRLRHIAGVYGFPLELVDDIDALLREADRERMVADEYRKVAVTEANLANDRIAELEAALRRVRDEADDPIARLAVEGLLHTLQSGNLVYRRDNGET